MPITIIAHLPRIPSILATILAVTCNAGDLAAQCTVDSIADYVKEEKQKAPPASEKDRIKAVVARCNKLSALTSCTLQYAIKRIEVGDGIAVIRQECMK
jgi:hypothetical protein